MGSLLRRSVLAWALAVVPASAGIRQAEWARVQEALDQGLPKSAIAALGPIIAGAESAGAYAEAVKALGLRISLEGSIQGGKPEEKIGRLQAEIAAHPAPMRALLEAILADWYWQYFRSNRWRFVQRTQIAGPTGLDLLTWDLPRILAEIDLHFRRALADAKTLQATPIAAFDELLAPGNAPDAYRPTLFDFLAHEALQCYTAGEQVGAAAEDAFVLAADSPIFAPAGDFVKWRPSASDDGSPTLAALRIYQSLLAFHQGDPDKSAFADVDLERLVFGFNESLGEEKLERYTAALKRFVDENGDHEIAARALGHWARALQSTGDLVTAHALASRGWTAFPDSPGGGMCFNSLKQIESKAASIRTERVWNAPLPDIQITYRNITQVFFRAVRDDYESRLEAHRGDPGCLDPPEREELLRRTPDLEWSAALPPTTDYHEHGARLPAPGRLEPGFYFVFCSPDSSFVAEPGQLGVAPVWVSDLALVVRARPAAIDGFVLDARTGEPIPGAAVRAWTRERDGRWKPDVEARAGEDGFFQIAPRRGDGAILVAQSGTHRLATPLEQQLRVEAEPRSTDRTILFSDRSIYRPGQTIYYKGIRIRFDPGRNEYRTLAGARVTIVFADPSGHEIARTEHTCNDYGSFEGTFTAPRDRLMGRMTLGGSDGRIWVSVEEYKRPKFEVELAAPAAAVRLNAAVAVPGKATTYTGAPVGGAEVRWQVVRSARFPVWCWWRRDPFAPATSRSQAIAHGTTTTRTDGSFVIRFTARPDPAIPAKDEPTFEYQVTADVTDAAGETRTEERRVRAAYTALRASVAVDDWQTPDEAVELGIETRSIDGDPQAAGGRVRLYRLQQPSRPVRADQADMSRHWSAPGNGDPAADPSNPDSWPLGRVVRDRRFRTDRTGRARVSLALEPGMYRAILVTRDRFGTPVRAARLVHVVDPRAPRFPVPIANHLTAPNWTVEPGHRFVALWGTGYESGRACVEIEHRGKLLQRFWTNAGRTQQMIEQAVEETDRGGFTLRVTFVRENRAYLQEHIVNVPWSNKQLTVRWESFRSKLTPGQKETWTAAVCGPGSQKAVVEMAAVLYDAALDAFLPHDWPHAFDVFHREHRRTRAGFANSTVLFALPFHEPVQGYRREGLFYRSFAPGILDGRWGYSYVVKVEPDRRTGAAGSFKGSVADRDTGTPMNFANVVVLGTMWGTSTRDGGRFQIACIPPGTYTVKASFVGYDPQTVTAKVDSGQVVWLSFRLARALGSMVETVCVSGRTADMHVRSSDVTHVSHDSEMLALPPESAVEAVALNTGVVTQGGARASLGKVAARKNLRETAFFFPCLRSDANGVVKLEFTMPEALTEWRFLAFAHDRELRSGFLADRAVTAKDLMVEPNPPRFVREGDTIELTVKVTNRTALRQTGRVELTLADAHSLMNMDPALGNTTPGRDFDVPEHESRTYSWRLVVPDGAGFLQYKAVGATATCSDGEEGYLPILSRRILVTESLPLPLRGQQTKQFEFEKLLAAAGSKTLRHQSLTVQMVSQPAWYAVMALPYLMEFPHECSEQVFNRLYANALARHIAASNPKIRSVFDRWKATDALDSPLEKNQDLKAVLLEETPWIRQAQAESRARRNVGLLFDDNRLDAEIRRTVHQLSEMQGPDGLWPWFPGGRPSEYMTLYITTGFGRLRHLGVEVDASAALKSLHALDRWMEAQYREILRRGHEGANNLSSLVALYLYGRSFFLRDHAVAAAHRDAFDYWVGQARQHWLRLGSRQSQAHVALGLSRLGNSQVPGAIVKSLAERSVTDAELGVFWRDLELSWWWHRAPIETQAVMIEAFAEIARDSAAVEACTVWLLKQKQTQDWKTTKATADAVYALLLRGANLLASDALVKVALADWTIEPEAVEAGTGFYEQRFAGGDVRPEMGRVTVTKVDAGVSWGSLHWQYLEDMTRITPHEGTALRLQKSLFVKGTTAKGPVLAPVAGPLAAGDELVTRIELRADRDMEYVHLIDQRGSGTEPVNVLSHYRYQDGLAYYESTRDTATHFFIDYLPKGTYVFESSNRIQHRGAYQTGIASIQCMYAPEFNSHSESLELQVQ